MANQQNNCPRLKWGVPKPLRKFADALCDFIDSQRPLESDGSVRVTDAPGGGKALSSPLSASSGRATLAPFQVQTRQKPGSKTTWQFAVSYGILYPTGTPDLSNAIAITGVPTFDQQNANPPTLTWHDWQGSDDVVYLDGSVDAAGDPDNPVTGVQVNSGSQGGTFNTTKDAWSDNDAWLSGNADPDITTLTIQDEFCFILAYITASEKDGSPIVNQVSRSNLLIKSSTVDANPALFPSAFY